MVSELTTAPRLTRRFSLLATLLVMVVIAILAAAAVYSFRWAERNR